MSRGETTAIPSHQQARTQGAERRHRRRGSASKQQANLDSQRDPTEWELISSIESLYRDQLRPYGRILRKRLVELGWKAPHADLCRLRAQCSTCPSLQVDTDDNLEWFVTIPGLFADFVDIYDTADNFSEQFWSEARSYFESSLFEINYLGGRYACAQGLASLGPPFLHGYSLGRVCHFVQLAMTTRKMLGYRNGAIVPYIRSETMLKERCAGEKTLCKSANVPPLTSWNVFRACLRELLDGSSEALPLSNIKRLFRSHFQADLSETVFGYSTVGELFRDERLKDVCSIQLLENGYHVFSSLQDCKDCCTIELVGSEDPSEQRRRRLTKRRHRRSVAHINDREVLAHSSSGTFSHVAEPNSPSTFLMAPLLSHSDTSILSASPVGAFAQSDGREAEASDTARHLTCQSFGLLHLDEQDEEEEANDDVVEELQLGPHMCGGNVVESDESEGLPSTPVAFFPPTPSPILCGGAFDFSHFSWRLADEASGNCSLQDTVRTHNATLSTDAGTSDDSCSVPSTPRMIVEATTAPNDLADEHFLLAVNASHSELRVSIRNTFISICEQGSRAHSMSSDRSSASAPGEAGLCRCQSF